MVGVMGGLAYFICSPSYKDVQFFLKLDKSGLIRRHNNCNYIYD